jgi:small-conductance mechanosensitive channel
MLKDEAITLSKLNKKPVIVTLIGTIFFIILIILTLEVSHRDLNSFVTAQQKYILSVESLFLVAFLVEMLARLATLHSQNRRMVEFGTRMRLMVRITGYGIGSLAVISILASNPTLGISVGAILGALIVFSTQNILGSILATVFILSTRMIHIGEEISVGNTKGIVSDINLTHTIVSIDEDIVLIPNSTLITSAIRRKKRDPDKEIETAGSRKN